MKTSGAPFPFRLISALLATTVMCSPVIPSCAARTRSVPEISLQRKRGAVALARVAQVKATATDKGVLLQWRTAFEIDNLGFNVYRDRKGRREQINPGIIAGSALIVGQGTALDSGYGYSWFDSGGTLDCKYYLEDIDISGKSTVHEEIIPEWSASLPKFSQAQLLSDLGTHAPGSTLQTEWAEIADNKSGDLAAEAISAGTINDQWMIANQPALKIGVRSNGWYRIPQAEMVSAGFDTSADARNLRMFVNASEIAISVSRDNGALGSSDYVEFWGQGLDTASTDTQVYWLVNGAQPGKRIARVAELRSDGTNPPSGRPAIQALNPLNPPFSPGWFTTIGTAAALSDRFGSPNARQRSSVTSGDQLPADNHYDTPTVEPNGSPVVEASSNTGDSRSVTNRRDADRTTTIAKVSSPSSNPRVLSSAKSSRRSSHRRRRHRRNHSNVPLVRRNHTTPVAVATAPAFIYNVERKTRLVYATLVLNGDTENFFGDVIVPINPDPNSSCAHQTPAQVLTLHNVEASAAGLAQLQIALQGLSQINHQVNIFLNGSQVGTISFFGLDHFVQTFSVPLSSLVEGDNIVQIVPSALCGSGVSDFTAVDYTQINYPHSLKADNNSLQFSFKSTQSARIDGFTVANIRVFDISDASALQEIRPVVETSGAGYAVTVPAGARGKARHLIALPDTQILHPASITLNQPSTLNGNANGADLLIISYKDFIPALAPLVAQRRDRDGLTVKVADVEDIYDEFSYGVHTSQAIKDFLSLARTSWAKSPRYVLLVGDASYDPRNYMGQGFLDFVPSKHVDTFYMEADSDDSLADFDNDGIPEIPVGRLPARTLAQANLIIGKIVNFSPANVPQSALMVADNPVGYDFEAFSENLITLLPSSMSVQRVYRSSDPSPHDDIINKINQGVSLVNYSGHGNVDIWAGPIFSSGDALALSNGNKLPFVVVMDCLNGFFSDPVLEGLAESLMKAPNGGAVASFASSGLTVADPQHQMGQQMFRLLYQGPSMAIGDASRQSKSATTDLDVRRTWILFGDPTMKIR